MPGDAQVEIIVGWGVVEYFKDAVDRVCHMEPMGEVVVDHVAVALLNR